MQQIKSAWNRLDRRRQIIAGLAALAVFLGILALSRMSVGQDMKLLYAGLDSPAAGEVVQSLEQQGAVYEVRGSAIYVAAEQRDALRMTLAGEGLPNTGSRGYELLDSLTGFGTTSQMFDAAYWRAKEGELARTIVANPRISQARVHIASNGANPFRRTIEPTASVSVTSAGPALPADQARAIQFLVASAVPGLTVENVAVVDAKGAILSSQGRTAQPEGQDDRADLLRERVLRLVEARVGAGNAVVEVSIDTVTETESIRERRIDPDSRVVISTDTQERANNSTGTGGEVTVASNLPDSEDAGGNGSKSSNSETRESVTYKVSETELEIHRQPGAVRRLTVAVLVNGLANIGDDGAEGFSPRPEEELDALRDLVASAVGFDSERGDRITLKSMELTVAEPLGTAATSGLFERLGLNAMPLAKMMIVALVSLVLGLFVVRPILLSPASEEPPKLVGPANRPRDVGASDSSRVLTGEIENDDSVSDNRAPNLPVLADTGTDQNTSAPAVDRLRALIGERRQESVEILRGWLEEREKAS